MADASSRDERSTEGGSWRARLSTHRPVFDRLFFGVALLGVLVAVHLLIQQGRGFDRGCLGFSAPAAAAQASTFNCELVTQSGAGTLLGVSNAWWGIGFYLAVAGLSAAAAFVGRRFRFAAARAVLIAGGLGYSVYLTYHQFAGLGALCALCLTSAAIALTLFIVQAVMLARPVTARSSSSETAPAMTASARRPALWGGAALALLVLIGADLAYFSSLETNTAEPVAAETAAPDASASSGEAPAPSATPSQQAGAALPSDTTEGAALPPGCQFAPNQEPVEDGRLVSFSDPVYGAEDAPVTVVEFFDPNCPHCATFHTTMKGLVAQYGERVRFVYKPIIVIGQQSINQIGALHAASRQGKFKEMMEAQYARQQRGGLSNDQLASIAREIGMNPDPMLAQIRQGGYRERIQRDLQLASEAGVRGTPSVAINGRLVARRAKTPRCISALIERKLDQANQQSPDASEN